MKRPHVVAIGASAGGVEALMKILPGLRKPSELSVLVVLHFPPQGPNLLPEIYKDVCKFRVKEAESGEQIMPETVYIAPPDYHLSAEADYTISLSTEETVNYSRPSIDVLMDSIAVSYQNKGCGIILTGANHDGSAGMRRIHKNGGLTIVQDPNEATYPAMPNSCLSLFKPDYVLGLEQIREKLSQYSGVRNG